MSPALADGVPGPVHPPPESVSFPTALSEDSPGSASTSSRLVLGVYVPRALSEASD